MNLVSISNTRDSVTLNIVLSSYASKVFLAEIVVLCGVACVSENLVNHHKLFAFPFLFLQSLKIYDNFEEAKLSMLNTEQKEEQKKHVRVIREITLKYYSTRR